MIINFYFPSLGPLLTNGWIKDLVKDLVKDMEVDSVFLTIIVTFIGLLLFNFNSTYRSQANFDNLT